MAYFGQQSKIALIARSTQMFAPIQSWVNKGWGIFAGPGALWGAQGLEIPLNINTGQYALGDVSVPFSSAQARFTRYPVMLASTGAVVFQSDIDKEIQATKNGSGINQFFVGQTNIGTNLTLAVEQMAYTGDRSGYMPGFLGSENTIRYVSQKSVMSMSGQEFYRLIAQLVADLVAENPNIGDGGITISIPTPYISKLSEYITVAGGGNGATPISNTVKMAIENLDFKPRIIYHTPALGSAYADLSAYNFTTAAGSNMTKGNMCIYVGLNTPTVCGIGADISLARAEGDKIRRLQEEFSYTGDPNAYRWTTEDIYETAIEEGGRELKEEMESMERDIVNQLRSTVGRYSGVAPENILPVQLLPWVFGYEYQSRASYKMTGQVYCAGGIVAVPNMMIAIDTADAIPANSIITRAGGTTEIKIGDNELGATPRRVHSGLDSASSSSPKPHIAKEEVAMYESAEYGEESDSAESEE